MTEFKTCVRTAEIENPLVTTAPAPGDRVAYVIVKGAPGPKGYEKTEDPIFVLGIDLPIDTMYYLNNQLTKPGYKKPEKSYLRTWEQSPNRHHVLPQQPANDLSIDTMYYLDNQLARPRGRIFEPMLGEKKAWSLL
ncbi:hypothetical protein NU219Hw_g3562t1 [Hortaea werneckii]